MPNYVPCRTGHDDDSHLYAPNDPSTALCGKSVAGPTGPEDDTDKVCPACGRRLLARILKMARPGGITSVEVTVT